MYEIEAQDNHFSNEEFLSVFGEDSQIDTFKGKGCDICKNTGYKGRLGIYEAILTSDKIETAIENNPSEREIWTAAKGQGILTMKQDGVIKILSGVTSLDELERVIALTD